VGKGGGRNRGKRHYSLKAQEDTLKKSVREGKKGGGTSDIARADGSVLSAVIIRSAGGGRGRKKVTAGSTRLPGKPG